MPYFSKCVLLLNPVSTLQTLWQCHVCLGKTMLMQTLIYTCYFLHKSLLQCFIGLVETPVPFSESLWYCFNPLSGSQILPLDSLCLISYNQIHVYPYIAPLSWTKCHSACWPFFDDAISFMNYYFINFHIPTHDTSPLAFE